MAIAADDILLSLFVLGQPKGGRFRAMSRDVHGAVRQLKESYPDLFCEFVFTETTTAFPYSERLAEAMQDLEWSRLVGMENPDFRVYYVKPSAQGVFDTLVRPRITQDQTEQLTTAAQRFWHELGV